MCIYATTIRETLVRTVGVSAEIQTGHLLDESQKRYWRSRSDRSDVSVKVLVFP
jgi:hypothetical protein